MGILILPQGVRALPLGSTTLGVETRLTERSAFGLRTTTRETDYEIGVQQLLPRDIILDGFTTYADEPGLHRPGAQVFQLSNIRYQNALFDVIAGDSFLNVTTLDDDPPRAIVSPIFFPPLTTIRFLPTSLTPQVPQGTRFINFVSPSLSLRGFRLSGSRENSDLVLYGGNVSTTKGFVGFVPDVSNELAIGAKGRYRPSDRLLLSAGYGHTEDSDPLPDGNRIRTDHTANVSALARVLPSTYLRAETGFSAHSLDSRDETISGTDPLVVIGPLIRHERFILDANYRRIGTNYAPLERFGLTDREGYFTTTTIRPWQPTTLFGSFERSHDNLRRDPKKARTTLTNGSLGVSELFPTRTLVSLQGNLGQTLSDQGQAGPTRQMQKGVQVEASQTVAGFRPLFRYRRDTTDNRTTRTSTSTETYHADVGKALGLGGFLVSEDVTRQIGEGGRETQRSYITAASGSLRLVEGADLSVQLSWTHLSDRTRTDTTDQYGLGGFLTWALPLQITLRGELRYDTQPGIHGVQVTVRLTKQFSYGEAPLRREVPSTVALPSIAPIGVIEGTVLISPTREGVPNVRIVLDDGTAALTDARGRFQFREVFQGDRTIRIDERKLPAAFDVIGTVRRTVQVRPRGTARVEFELTGLGSIRGRVIEDKNRNGVADPDEPGMENIRVIARSEGKDFESFTDADGGFTFSNLRPGRYRLRLDPAWLPEDAMVLPAVPLEVGVAAGGEVSDQLFLVQIKPRPVRRRTFGQVLPPPGISVAPLASVDYITPIVAAEAADREEGARERGLRGVRTTQGPGGRR